jgi:hypothetical protein
MSLLPLISHHLFVSAVANEEGTPGESAAAEAGATSINDAGNSVPLELLDLTVSLPERAAQLGWGAGAES